MRSVTATLCLLLASASVALALGGRQGEPAARVTAVAAEGSIEISSSGNGQPIFSAGGLAPGDTVSGTVQIVNTGSEPARLELSQRDVKDVPGNGGGLLSEALSGRVLDVTAPAAPVTVYAGPLAPMGPRPAGELAPGESRTYEFLASLPVSGGGPSAQNAVQGAATAVAYTWTASEVTVGEPERGPGQEEPGRPGREGTPLNPGTLRLTVSRVRRSLTRGRLLVRAGCETSCRIALRGRLIARAPDGHHAFRLRLRGSHRYLSGQRRLQIRVPASARRWLRAHPGRVRLTAKLAFVARDGSGRRVVAKRTVRLRRPR